jgi:DNA segregation ATPase FtsK/SpoIIIE-like protein
MVRAGVNDWRRLPEPLPLLVLVVDEAADIADTTAMKTLVQIARKGRAFGVSVILGTQYPTSQVIDPQIKANLPTAIAFQCRTQTESRVILDRAGAETLDRPGLALMFVDGHWRRVQVLNVDPALIEVLPGTQESEPGPVLSEVLPGTQESEPGPVLSEVETALVRYAIEELDGAFTVNRLYDALGDEISRRQINYRAKDWERRGWLTPPQRDESGHPIGRQVTPELKNLAGIAPAHEGPTEALESGNAVTRVSERNKAQNPGNRGGNRAVTGPEDVVERRSPDTALLPPHYCPVTACRWNSEGRGVCDYAQRGLRCGNPQWRDEWREAVVDIEGQ